MKAKENLVSWSGCFIRIVGKEPGKPEVVLFESGSAEESKRICDEAYRLMCQRAARAAKAKEVGT